MLTFQNGDSKMSGWGLFFMYILWVCDNNVILRDCWFNPLLKTKKGLTLCLPISLIVIQPLLQVLNPQVG